MTKEPISGRCRWCGAVLPAPAGTGRPRRYCRRSCRQRHYEDHQVHGLVLGSQQRLDDLSDRVFVLAGAVRDVERLLARGGDADPDDQRVALVWLLEAARPLVDTETEERAAPPVT